MLTEEDIEPFDVNKLITFGDLLQDIQSFGARYIGLFEDDIPHGEGDLFLPDGQV